MARYDVDLITSLRKGEQIHPFFHALMRTNFNIKEFATDILDLSTGKNRLRNPMSSQNLFERMSKIRRVEDTAGGKTRERFVNYLGFDPTTEAGQIKTIVTWDEETTGVTSQAKIRTTSLVKRQVRVNPDGTTTIVSAPEVIMTKHFRANQADIAHVFEDGSPVKKAVTLSERNT